MLQCFPLRSSDSAFATQTSPTAYHPVLLLFFLSSLLAAERIGVFAEPEVVTKQLNAQHPFIVIASDGVFEFLTSQSVVDMVRVERVGVECKRMGMVCISGCEAAGRCLLHTVESGHVSIGGTVP